jgi:hypothetical protein
VLAERMDEVLAEALQPAGKGDKPATARRRADHPLKRRRGTGTPSRTEKRPLA